MTGAQRRLVRYWTFVLGFIGTLLLIAFLYPDHLQLATLVLLVLFWLLSMFQDFTYYRGFGDGSQRIGVFIERHPYLKLWLVITCILFLPIMIYWIQTKPEISHILYFLCFLLLIGPIAVYSELERFRSLGQSSDG